MMWKWPYGEPHQVFCIKAEPFDLQGKGNMPAFVKVLQIDDPDRRGRIVNAIHRQADALGCDYEVSILAGEGGRDWDLVVQSPDGREACRILYENQGDLAAEALERHLRELMQQLRCTQLESISRDLLK